MMTPLKGLTAVSSKAVVLLPLLLGLSVHLVLAQECIAGDSTCGLKDTHERCPVWKEEGYCRTENKYMNEHCPRSCSIKGESADSCSDLHPRCKRFSEIGECQENPVEMFKNCCRSCGMENVTLADLEGDTETSCTDTDERCPFWSSKGECEKNPWMKLNCPKSCKSCTKKESVKKKTLKVDLTTDERDILQRTADFGKVQTVAGAEAAETYEVIWKTIEYFDTEAHSLPEKVLKNCLNKNDLCSFWAVIGECKNNQSYMITNCAPACRSCALIDIEARCPPISNQKPALRPGELNKMFENIIENAPGNRTLSDDERLDLEQKSMPEYTVSVHSRPSESAITEINKANDMKSPPWIVVFDNFTSAEECQHLIDLGHKHQYHRSRDYGAKQFDGTFENVESQRRTSENAWCSTHSGCRSEDIPQRIHNRMGEVMGIEPNNSEDFQILKYLNGQFYRQHHDYIQHHVDRQCGPRMLTFFLYLSDVEVGGGTKFNELGLTVQPKRGRAVLWPSVLNSDPLSKDPRTEHEALSVKEGTKYAANGWIHMYDYVAAHTRGCT